MPPQARKPREIRSANVDPRMPASVVVMKFGGLTRFCDWTGFKTSTVWDWMINGYVPSKRQPHVMEMAKLHGVDLEPADFVFQPDKAA